MKVRPWPNVTGEDRWSIELMDELFATTTKSPAQLRSRAEELRAEARTTELEGYRRAALALADRYELAAASRARD
jgi:hypothetical protein